MINFNSNVSTPIQVSSSGNEGTMTKLVSTPIQVSSSGNEGTMTKLVSTPIQVSSSGNEGTMIKQVLPCFIIQFVPSFPDEDT